MDTKHDLWDYTKEKYIIPEVAYNWTTITIREAWRRHRSDLKMTYYDPYDNDKVRMAKRPSHIPECQFRELLKYWKSEKFKKMSETNTKNRKKLMNPHTAGKKSFALVRNKLIRRQYHLRISLWLQEQENPRVCTRLRMKILLVKLPKWRKLKNK